MEVVGNNPLSKVHEISRFAAQAAKFHSHENDYKLLRQTKEIF